MRNWLVTFVVVGVLGLAPAGSLAQPAGLAPPAGPMAKWSAADIQAVQQQIGAAKTEVALADLQKRINAARQASALEPATAQGLLQLILAKEITASGKECMTVARCYRDIADCMSFGDKTAVDVLKYALQLAYRQPNQDRIFVEGVRHDLVRQMVINHAPVDDINKYSPPCPSCHGNGDVVPIFGFVPMQQKDYGYRFVTGSCAHSQQWYCRACKMSFFPKSNQEMIIDEKPQ